MTAIKSHSRLHCRFDCSWSRSFADDLISLFKSTHIQDIEIFQDEELKHNNFVNLMLWESHQIWSSVVQSDIVISLEIETEKDCTSSRALNFWHVLRDEFIFRLYQSFLSSLDDESIWRELMNRLNERFQEDYFRLNIFFSDQELAIDDINCMNDLRASVHLRSRMFQDIKSIVSTLLTFTFFFELITISLFDSCMFHCQEIIQCRLQNNVIIQALAQIHSSNLSFVTDFKTLDLLNFKENVCHLCHRYYKQVNFYIRHSSNFIVVYLQSDSHKRCKLDDFSQTMNWFVQQQNLDAVFETINHEVSDKLDCRVCDVNHLERSSSTKRRFLIDNVSKSMTKKRWLWLESACWKHVSVVEFFALKCASKSRLTSYLETQFLRIRFALCIISVFKSDNSTCFLALIIMFFSEADIACFSSCILLKHTRLFFWNIERS